MKYTLHENLGEREGVISNLHGFLHRYLDTGFSSKWSGYWVPPYKFLDYYGIKINGIWLNRDTLQATEYGEKMVFYHETDSLVIAEKISTPEDLPGFRVELEVENKTGSRKAVQAILEAGIDIRSKEHDVEEGEYDIEVEKNRILASRKERKLVIESEEIEEFREESYIKEHHPGERQVSLVPEKPVMRKEIEPQETEKFCIDFKTSNGVFGKVETVEQCLDHELGRTFKSSIESLENLVYKRNGYGIIAGHPWFQSYWARDSFWSLLGLIDAGYFELSENILENFAEKELPGKIDLGSRSRKEQEKSDTAPLFIIASEKLRKHSGITEEIREGREKAMEELEMDGKIVDHSPGGTWMDTLEREKAVDIQSLWLEAAEIMEDERAERLREGLEEFKNKGILRDEIGGGHRAINPSIPLVFEQPDRETAYSQLEKINGEFSSLYGARTRSVTDPEYKSSGYHTGSAWSLTTCWAAAANFRYGRFKEGLNFLEKLDIFLDREQPGALPEVVDAETGESLGASEQAWSAGMFVHVVDSHMLGINVEEDHVEIDPAGNLSCTRKGKRVRGEKVDIEIVEGEVEILNDPDLDIRTGNQSKKKSVAGK